jgi:hypothetical protein
VSDFRRFCIAFSALELLLVFTGPDDLSLEQIARSLIVSFIFATTAVALFGRHSHVEREG